MGLHESLERLWRCKHTGGDRVCVGHWDYYAEYMVWTRHHPGYMAYKVVPYDHPAPECIGLVSLN